MDQHEQNRRIFDSAIEAHADSMYRVAFRMCGRSHQAEEIVQETFIGAWNNIAQLRDSAKVKSWLFGILRNQCFKSLSKEKKFVASDNVDELESNVESDGILELQDQVQSAIAMLDDEHRMPILLVSMEGWSTEEAAEFLGIPKGTVLSRLHRGRLRLKQILAREFEMDTSEE